jgi:hypothetical protein
MPKRRVECMEAMWLQARQIQTQTAETERQTSQRSSSDNEIKEGKEWIRLTLQAVASSSAAVLHALLLGRLLGLFLHLAGWWFQAILKFFFPSPKWEMLVMIKSHGSPNASWILLGSCHSYSNHQIQGSFLIALQMNFSKLPCEWVWQRTP